LYTCAGGQVYRSPVYHRKRDVSTDKLTTSL